MLPSSSKLALAQRCAYPWTSGIAWPVGGSSAAAQMGTAVHAIAEAWARGEPVDIGAVAEAPAYEFTPSEQARFVEMATALVAFLEGEAEELVSLGEVPTLGVEVPLAYDPASGMARWLASSGQRDYSDVRAGEISGTIDMLITSSHGRVKVRDWKTGEAARQKRAIDTPQLRFFGLAVARAMALDQVDIELAHVDEDGVYLDAATLDAFDLDVIAGELRELIDGMPARVAPVVGPHCEAMYCPIIGRCPASITALERVAEASAVQYPLRGGIESSEQAVEVRQRLGMMRAVLDEIEVALKAYVSHYGPIPAGEGKVWGPRTHAGRETIDLSVDGAEAALRETLAEGAGAAIEVRTSKAGIERGAKAQLLARHGEDKPPRGAQKKVVDEAMERMRALRAIKVGAPYEQFEEFRRSDNG